MQLSAMAQKLWRQSQGRVPKGGSVSELFYKERFNTPTGWMLLVTDPEQRLRSLEWEDKGDRMHRLRAAIGRS